MVKQKKSKLERILDKQGLSEEEIITLIKSSRGKPSKTYNIDIPGKHFKYMYISDTHIGHKKFLEPLFMKAIKHAKKEGVDFIVNPGDHLEGMSGRPGHVYELNKIGFDTQINYAADLYNQFSGKPHYGIDGNHDQWYYKKHDGGLVVGKALERLVKGYKHLGQDEGDIIVTPKIKIKLFHANDGSAYATSYKLQKLIESFTGGEKPEILHSGHYHKALYTFQRNVHGFESGTLCGQSQFMKGKKLPAHTGYGIVEVYHDKNGIDRIKHEFVPYYEK